MENFQSIAPKAFLQQYEAGNLGDAQIIDVREQMEWDYYHLENTDLIPMSSIPAKLQVISKEKTTYFICAHGVRSYHACQYLSDAGYSKVVNVEGGMAAVSMLLGFQYD